MVFLVVGPKLRELPGGPEATPFSTQKRTVAAAIDYAQPEATGVTGRSYPAFPTPSVPGTYTHRGSANVHPCVTGHPACRDRPISSLEAQTSARDLHVDWPVPARGVSRYAGIDVTALTCIFVCEAQRRHRRPFGCLSTVRKTTAKTADEKRIAGVARLCSP
uniref:Uncharacterized protein ORF12 n=1 Tax=Alternaria alternata TaxID=5599 RepID=C9K7F4_ALTAL|nr:hypothetical protein [Alternaria alternata]